MSRWPHYCGGLGLTFGQWARGWLADKAKAEAAVRAWPQFRGGTIGFTARARVAIAGVCAQLQLDAGAEVLVPAYNCGSEVDPIVRSGAQVRLYRVNRRGEIDPEDLRSRVTGRTRLIYVTHYFGWPQAVERVAPWAQARGIGVLEDCALALFSGAPGGPIGGAGDAAVFSFPKTLGVADGGGVVLRGRLGRPGPTHGARPPMPSSMRTVAGLMARQALRAADRLGVYPVAHAWLSRRAQRRIQRAARGDADLRKLPPRHFYDRRQARWGPSRTTLAVIQATAPETVVRRRRANYALLHELLAGTGRVQPLYADLPEGVCPLAYPVIVEDRRRWLEALALRGVAAIPWWAGYHPALDWREHGEASFLKDHVLALPVHQDLGPAQIAFVGEVVGAAGRAVAGATPRAGMPRAQPG